MPIDASIISGLKPVQMESPMNGLAKLLEVQGAQQNMQMGRMKMDEYQRGLTDENQMRELTRQSGGDMNKLRELAYGAGNYRQGSEIDKTLLANKKAGLDQQKAELEGHLKKIELSAQIMSGVTDQSSYDRARQKAAEVFGPEAAAKIPAEYNPALIAENQAKAMDMKTQMEQKWKAMSYTTPDANSVLSAQTSTANNAATNATSRSNNAASVGASYANAGATREIAKATRDAATIQTGFASEQGLRKEFEGLPEVKNYKQAYPAYAAIKDATGRNTTQSDINIVYGLAKLYDPTSVVREGEYATVANSPSIPEKVKGYAQFLAGGGRLSPETKRQILAEANGRIGTYKAEADKAKGSYEGIARKRGMDPSSVFADMGDIGSGAAPPAPVAAPAMPAGFRVIR